MLRCALRLCNACDSDRASSSSSSSQSQTCLPSGVSTSLCCRAGAPVDTNPTRRLLTPSASCCLITWCVLGTLYVYVHILCMCIARHTSPPKKSHLSLLLFAMVQVSPASTGVMCSSRSFPDESDECGGGMTVRCVHTLWKPHHKMIIPHIS